ncbi:ORF6N domain-containing protein [Sulfuritalea sp.]|uniref:ORF6N domain-containing protein n=1 Tax=Sulfuritalea sp. TaxID=2480090 RepID=UPI00286DAC7B|nr:ORF6N domain-containing protein [Sulfuritalea sp.]
MTNIAPKPENLAQLVFLIRGEKVLLDADLAMLYGVETGALNRAVKRNLDRFPDDFMFQLGSEDWENLKCQIGISSASTAASNDKQSGPMRSQIVTAGTLDYGIFCLFHWVSRVGSGDTAMQSSREVSSVL